MWVWRIYQKVHLHKSLADNLLTMCVVIVDTSETASIDNIEKEVAYKTDYCIIPVIVLVMCFCIVGYCYY